MEMEKAGVTFEESLCEGPNGAGVCQVQLSHLHLRPADFGANLERRLLPLLHISTPHDHPRPWNTETVGLELVPFSLSLSRSSWYHQTG